MNLFSIYHDELLMLFGMIMLRFLVVCSILCSMGFGQGSITWIMLTGMLIVRFGCLSTTFVILVLTTGIIRACILGLALFFACIFGSMSRIVRCTLGCNCLIMKIIGLHNTKGWRIFHGIGLQFSLNAHSRNSKQVWKQQQQVYFWV